MPVHPFSHYPIRMLVAAAGLTAAGSVHAQCQWDWARGYERSGGQSGIVWDSVVFDDGSGPALYVCTDSGRIQKFTGRAWSEIGRAFGNVSGVAGGNTYNLDVCDADGPDGPESAQLVVCGFFRRMQGPTGLPVTAVGVARWDGTQWLDTGTSEFSGAFIRGMTIYNDDGTGGKLVVSGPFAIGSGRGVAIRGFDGGWSLVGEGQPPYFTSSNELTAVHAFDDGTGQALYVGGLFAGVGGVSSPGVVKFTGDAWAGLGAGVQYTTGEGGRVYHLTSFDDGTGAKLIASGNIASSGGDTTIRGIAKWTGTTWVGFTGADFNVGQFGPYARVLNLGNGPELYLSGRLGTMAAQGLAKWDGAAWVSPNWDAATLGQPLSVNAFDPDHGGPLPTRLIAMTSTTRSLNGTEWRQLPDYPDSKSVSQVVQLTALDADGPGPDETALFATGSFSTSADGQVLNRLARYNGVSWSPVLGGLPSLERRDPEQGALPDGTASVQVFDDGTGPSLYVGGGFNYNDGAPARRIIRWNGSAWVEVGGGIGDVVNNGHTVWTMTVYNDGTGSALYAAGSFVDAGGTPVSNIAKWNGANWSDVGGGLTGTGLVVRTSVVHNDGSGPKLYVAGTIATAGGNTVSNIARWDGTAWSDVGGGIAGEVFALHVHDEGNGPMLFAAGSFTVAGGGPVGRVARWDGTSWSSVGAGMGRGAGLTGTVSVQRLATVVEDGQSYLVASGSFETADFGSANSIARWNGLTWSGLGNGLTRIGVGLTSSGTAMASVPGPGRPSIYVAGTFDAAGSRSAAGFARWMYVIPADYNGSGSIGVQDIFDFLSGYFGGEPAADFNGSGAVTVQDIFDFLAAYFSGC